jgi:putative redox protein
MGMEKRVEATWASGMEFEAQDERGVRITMGSEESLAFRPSALVLAGLAGCTGMDAVSIMSKKRVQVSSYRVEAVGQQRDEHPRVFTHITVTHIVEGTSLDDAAIRRAIELSARKYCTVGATIAAGDTTIDHELRMIDELGERTCDCLTIGPRGQGLANIEGGLGGASTA